MTLAFAAIPLTSPTAADRAGRPEGRGLADTFIALDARFATVGSATNPGPRVNERLPRLSDCDHAACVVDHLFSDGRLVVTGEPSSFHDSTLSGLIVTDRGSCAALVALALAVADRLGIDLGALVFEQHVVLFDPVTGVTYETGEHGRVISPQELQNRFPGQRPIRAIGPGFVPYYLDNLASRLALAGEPAAAEAAFREAIRMAPRAWRPRYGLGTLLLQLDRDREALAELKHATRQGCPLAACWTNRAVALQRLGRTRAADRCLRKARATEAKRQRFVPA